MGTCIDECIRDQDCGGINKCCFNGCGRICSLPAGSGDAPRGPVDISIEPRPIPPLIGPTIQVPRPTDNKKIFQELYGFLEGELQNFVAANRISCNSRDMFNVALMTMDKKWSLEELPRIAVKFYLKGTPLTLQNISNEVYGFYSKTQSGSVGMAAPPARMPESFDDLEERFRLMRLQMGL